MLQRNRTLDEVFEILKKNVFVLSSQLGGISEDPQEIVNNFNIIDNENLVEFYHKSVTNSNIIILQKYTTWQNNIFIGKFTSLLYKNH